MSILLFVCFVCKAVGQDIESRIGLIDLSHYNFQCNPPVDLIGQYLIVDGLSINADSIKGRGKAAELFVDTWYQWERTSFGAKTYLCTIVLPASYRFGGNQQMLGMRIRHVFSSYRLYLNGELLAEQGNVFGDAVHYKSQFGYRNVFFVPKSDTIVLCLQVTNYLNPGVHGPEEIMQLGSSNQIVKTITFNNFLYIVSFGVMIIFVFYHLMYFWLRRRQKLNLIFAIICVLFAVKCLFEGDKLIFSAFPSFPSVLYYKAWFLSIDILYFLILFYHLVYPQEVKRWFVSVTLVVYSVFSAIIIALPVSYGFFWSKIIYLYSIIVILYAFRGMILAVIRKLECSWLNLLGIIPPAFLGINDLLFSINVLETGYFSAIGFMFYIAMQSATMTYQAVKSFKNEELLSNKLEEINQNLEHIVDVRTNELHVSNKSLNQTIATKDRFFSILAHDLKGPMSTIRSLLEIMVMRQDSYSREKMRTMLHALSESSRTTYDLLDNLLNWSKTQNSEIVVKKAEYDLCELVDENILLFKAVSEQKNIELINQVTENTKVFCDRNMTSTVIRNLINNALKFTVAGHVRISSQCNGAFTVIQIEDTGIGMTEDIIKALFDKEIILPTTHGTAGEKGSGLGLVLCREFVVHQGGQLIVKSERDKGTCFEVRLPTEN